MQNLGTHECYTCGYVWKHGAHGGHSCSERLLEQNKRLKVLISEREQNIDGLTCKLQSAIKIMTDNLDWVRCGIGANYSGDPYENKNYLAQKDFIISNKVPEQCLNQIKADAVNEFALWLAFNYDDRLTMDKLVSKFNEVKHA